MKKKILFFLTLLSLLFLPFISFAQNPTSTEQEEPARCICDRTCEKGGLMVEVSDECACCGCCQLIDVLRIVRGVANLILRWIGVIALVFFIVGGIMWLTSGGNVEQVKKGKQILVGTIIGILIVFLAWQIVNIVICALSQGQIAQSCKIFGVEWYKFPTK